MADGYIDIDVKLNGSPAEKQADALGQKLGQQVQKGVDSANKATETSTKQALNNIGGTLTAFGAAYTKSVTLPIAAAAVATGASAVKIDTALTGVRKTVDGTAEQYEALKDAAIEFSKTNAVDPAQILDIQALGAQLGYSIDELDLFAETISGISLSSNLGAEEAATQLAQFANIMGMSHDETKNFGSTLIDLGNNFATTEADISEMAMRLAGAGKQMGLSEADVLGLATALSSMGITAEAGGTAISTVMSQIDKDVALGTDNLKTWADTANMSVDEFSKAWGEDAVGALSAVLVGMDSAVEEGGNMAVMLDELGINAIRQTDALKRLASNSSFLGDAVDTANRAWEENIALDKEVANRNNSMASQLQILWNKVNAVAIEVGEPLMKALIGVLDAADPLVDALASGAQAFADLDEEGQRTVLMAVGIVAAFGPMTSIAGKVLSNVGKLSDGWKTLSSNAKIVNANLKANAASMAASAKATAGQVNAQTKLKTVMAGGQPVIMKYNEETKKWTVASKANMAATNAQVKGVKALTAANNLGSAAMKAGATAARTLGNALKSIAPIAIFSAAIGLITKLTDAISDARKKAEEYQAATKGLEAAASGVNVQLNAETGAFKSLASSIDSIDLEDFTEQHKNLAKTIQDASQEAATSQARLGQYNDAIQELAGRSDLTGAEVAKLKLAVDAVNDACGTSYEVVQDNAGAYQVMADGAVVAKDAIYDVIEAQKAQIRAEVEAENYKAAYEQMAKDQEALADATNLVAQRQEEYNRALANMEKSGADAYMDGTAQAAANAESALNDAKNALSNMEGQAGSTQSALNKLEEQQILTNMAMEDSASAVIRAADANLAFKAGVQGLDVDLVAFTQALMDMGFTSDQVASMSAEDAMKLANGWKSGYDSMKSATEEVTGSLPDALANMGQAAYDNAYGTGEQTGQGFVDGVSSNQGEAEAAGEANANSAVDGMGSQDSTSEGAQLVRRFAAAIGNGASQAEQGGKKDAIAAKQGMQSQDGNAKTWGNHLGDLFASGIRAAQNAVSSAGEFLAGIVKNILGHTVAKEGPLHEGGKGEYVWGLHLVENIADGMTSSKAKSAIRTATREVAVELSDGLKAEMAGIEPMAQLQASITQGNSALNMSSMMVGAAPSYTTNNQALNFYGDYSSPDIIAREMRMQQHYGLAGKY